MAIPVLSFQGDAFNIGWQIGQQSATAMHRYMGESHTWQQLREWKKSPRLKLLEKIAKQRFPLYFKEIEGISKGAQLDVTDIFLWNCRGDLLENSYEGCTTFVVPGKESTLIGHNEDGDPFFKGHVFIAEIKPDKGIGFTSFVYPCSLPGHAFAISNVGLVQTVNNLRLKKQGVGVPRQFLSRAVLNVENLDDAQDLFDKVDRSGGYHHTLGQCGDKRILSVEASSEGLSVKTITEPYGHANHLIHPEMKNLAQRITESSRSRQQRIDELCLQQPAKPDSEILFRHLYDQRNRILPIFREDPNDSDNENTLATALFEITKDQTACRVYESKNKVKVFTKRIGKHINSISGKKIQIE